MAIRQVSVFLENREGHLNDVLNALAEKNVDIIVASLADNKDYGVLRMIIPDPEEAHQILREAEFSAKLVNIICIKGPNNPGSLAKALSVLAEADVNIEYMYAFSGGDRADAIIKTKDIEIAEKVLIEKGFELWDEESLSEGC